jgi:putative endonuclease
LTVAVVYILQCADGTLYTGWTTDLERRLRAHSSGQGARYTRGRRPLSLVYHEEQPTRSAAQRREAAIRRLSRADKLKLIERKRNGESY